MKTNVVESRPLAVTHEGGAAARLTPLQNLKRAVSTCLLFENTFYESGSEIASRISGLVDIVTFAEVCQIAREARSKLKLRHVPLFLCAEMCRKRASIVPKGRIEGINTLGDTIAEVCHRPDEVTEMLAIYWRNGKKPIPKQMKRGFEMALQKFSRYQLAKYAKKDGKVKLRDVFRMIHPRPKNKAQEKDWKDMFEGTMEAADTWEVALSAGEDKKATWTRLIEEEKLGSMAMIMNLRNMLQVGVNRKLIGAYLLKMAPNSKLLPFRYLAALDHAPQLAEEISAAMIQSIPSDLPRLDGRTTLLIDVSGSMDAPLSAKSTTYRAKAAGALAVLAREICDEVDVFTFSDKVVQIPNYRGVALMAAIERSQPHSGTYLGGALQGLLDRGLVGKRVIVITDEQAHDQIPHFSVQGYIVNVAPYVPALKAGAHWTRISGFSERLLEWIAQEESTQ